MHVFCLLLCVFLDCKESLCVLLQERGELLRHHFRHWEEEARFYRNERRELLLCMLHVRDHTTSFAEFLCLRISFSLEDAENVVPQNRQLTYTVSSAEQATHIQSNRQNKQLTYTVSSASVLGVKNRTTASEIIFASRRVSEKQDTSSSLKQKKDTSCLTTSSRVSLFKSSRVSSFCFFRHLFPPSMRRREDHHQKYCFTTPCSSSTPSC